MERTSLYFEGDQKIRLKDEPLRKPEENEVLIKTLCSGISRGSELLIYRGDVEDGTPLDKSLNYPVKSSGKSLKYGYCCVGQIIETGEDVPQERVGDLVFSFNPHETHFIKDIEDVVILDEDIDPKNAIFLPFLETAVNFALDSNPVIGEDVMIFGQGVIGLLTTDVMEGFPLNSIVTSDKYEKRQGLSGKMGADEVFESNVSSEEILEKCGLSEDGFDLSFELTGEINVLQKAMKVLGFGGRAIIGSWYGNDKGEVKLDTDFHRSQIEIKSSQVSSIPNKKSARWDKERRLNTALVILKERDYKELITHKYEINKAAEAYEKLCNDPEDVVQTVLKY